MTPGRAEFPAVPLVRTDLAEPTVADRYELRSVLGSGGMGTVWEAFDIRLGRTVALKVLRDDLPPSAAMQLEREARAAARILDPRVVTVLDLARTADGNPYMVLECHDGHTLADELADGPLTPDRLMQLVEDLLGALGAAHRAGVLHRDVKPGNVLSSPEGFRVTDFGLASLDDDQSTETDIMGTLVYVAPERLDGARGSTRSDVFSAAVVIHEAATGRQPFRRSQPVESIAALRTGDVPPLPDTVPEPLRRTLQAALSPDPDRRPQDASAMLAQIHDARSASVDPGPDPTISLDATSVLPPVAAPERTVEVPEVDPAPAVEQTVTVPPAPASQPAPVATAPPVGPTAGDRAGDVIDRLRRRPELAIGGIAVLLLVTLMLAVATGGDAGDPAVADPGAPASLDDTLDRIEELGR